MAYSVNGTQRISDSREVSSSFSDNFYYTEFSPNITTTASVGTVNLDNTVAGETMFKTVMTGNCTFALTETNLNLGQAITIMLDRSTSGHTPTFPANISWPDGVAPTWSDNRYWLITLVDSGGGGGPGALAMRGIATGFGTGGGTTQNWPSGTFIARDNSSLQISAASDDNVTDVAPVSSSATLTIRVERTATGSEINVRHDGNTSGFFYYPNGSSISMNINTDYKMWEETSVVPDSVRIQTKTTAGALITDTGFVSTPGTGSVVTATTTASAYAAFSNDNDTDTDLEVHYVTLKKSGYDDYEVGGFRFYATAEANAVQCFVGSTQVLLWNDTTSATETIAASSLYESFNGKAEGDVFKVIGQDGAINEIISMRQRGVTTSIYSLNGSSGFITGGHPFLTTAGWKCISPEVGIHKYPDLNLTKLNVGDEIVKYNPETQTYFNEEVTSITGEQQETTVYTLDVDGNDTYIINNYVVHNK